MIMSKRLRSLSRVLGRLVSRMQRTNRKESTMAEIEPTEKELAAAIKIINNHHPDGGALGAPLVQYLNWRKNGVPHPEAMQRLREVLKEREHQERMQHVENWKPQIERRGN